MKIFFLIIFFSLSINSYSQTSLEYKNNGFAEAEAGNNIGAIADFNKAIELNPKYVRAYLLRGTSKYNLEDYRGAISDFDMVTSLDPKELDAYLLRGLAKIMLRQKDSGCLDFSKAGELGDERAYDMIKKYCN
jgi:tetratricopeptide (TPR) repeat protein